ncbi:MAG: ATP-binding protein, partial [Acidimicrobiia bacterium]
GSTAALVTEDLPEGTRLFEVGEVRLRDLARLERVFALVGDGLAPPEAPVSRGERDVEPISVRLLGPVEVCRDGARVDIGGPKERALLALLVLARGSVSSERLIDDMWDQSPPPSARKTLQTYAHRLRRAGFDDTLTTVVGGYELHMLSEPDTVRFERLVGEGTAKLQHGDHERARANLEEALELWQGDPFTGCAPTEALRGFAAHFTELRARAIESRLDADLQLGRHAEVVGELEHLVRADPYREPMWRMLVVALYRSGRQADALRACRRAGEVLRDELGIEPSAELKDLEHAVLEQRSSLDAPARPSGVSEVDGRPGGPQPTSPPVPATPLVGRDRERKVILSLLGNHRLVTLTGAGGSGKTRLVLAVAAELPEGRNVCFCDLALISDASSVAHAFARDTGVPLRRSTLVSGGEGDVMSDVISHLGNRQLVIVVDNCEHVLDACAMVVDRLLAACPGVDVLATSRAPLRVASEQMFPVAPLAVPADDDDLAADSVVLFAQRAAEARHSFEVTAANQAAVAQICRRLDGLPLALELAAARMSHLSPDDVVERLDRRFQLLESRYAARPERQRTLTALVDWSHELLTDAERTLFRRLAVFAGYFTLDAVHACCTTGIEGTDTLDLLGSLVDKSLVIAEHGPARTRYRLLETIRLYSEGQLAASDDDDTTRATHAAWCLARLETIPWDHRMLSPITAETLEQDHEDLRRAMTWATATGRRDLAARLITSMTGLLAIHGHFDEADRWLPDAIDYELGLPPGDRFATVAWAFMYLFRWDGDVERIVALRQRLAPIAENLPDGHVLTAIAYATLASLFSRPEGERERWGRYAAIALQHAPADAVHIRTKARCHQARALIMEGEYERAIAVIEDGEVVATDTDDETVWSPHEDLVLAHHLAGHDEAALKLAESRLGRWQHPQSTRFGSILAGVTSAALGDGARARMHLRDASESLTSTQRHPSAANDVQMAVGALAAIEGRREVAASLLAGMQVASMSTNAMGLLLEHYQARVRESCSEAEWQRFEHAAFRAGAVEIVRAEIGSAPGS